MGKLRCSAAAFRFSTSSKGAGVLLMRRKSIMSSADQSAIHGWRRGSSPWRLISRRAAGHLVAPGDLLEDTLEKGPGKSQIHYLLCRKRVLELEPSVLQSIARVDG